MIGELPYLYNIHNSIFHVSTRLKNIITFMKTNCLYSVVNKIYYNVMLTLTIAFFVEK